MSYFAAHILWTNHTRWSSTVPVSWANQDPAEPRAAGRKRYCRRGQSPPHLKHLGFSTKTILNFAFWYIFECMYYKRKNATKKEDLTKFRETRINANFCISFLRYWQYCKWARNLFLKALKWLFEWYDPNFLLWIN